MVNLEIQRKQIIVLALSIVLAFASYWIPLPREPQVVKPEILEAAPPTLISSALSMSTTI